MLADERHTETRTEKLGSTWVGATPPCRAVASADAALVAPAHVPMLNESSTEPDPNGVPN
jgi:hypothetical protein